jgi:hypothetical protein
MAGSSLYVGGAVIATLRSPGGRSNGSVRLERVGGADAYERELLDAFDEAPERLGRSLDAEDERDAAQRRFLERQKPRGCRASPRRERRDSNPRPPA